MKRRLVTIHKALKAAQAAQVMAIVADEIGDSDVLAEATADGITLYADSWNRKVAG